MDAAVQFLMGLECPASFPKHLLSQYNLISSPKILAHLHSILYVALAYHAVFLASKWILFPPVARLRLCSENGKPDRGVRRDLINQSALHFVSLVQSGVILYLCLTYWQTHGPNTCLLYTSRCV